MPGFIGMGEEYRPPDFCEDCGEPFPWLSREGRIYLSQNILDGADLEPAERLRAAEQLEALIDPELDDEEQARLWARFKKALLPYGGRRCAEGHHNRAGRKHPSDD